MTIAIWDYGIGGAGLYKLLRTATRADIVYFSDAGFTPYGKVSKVDLENRASVVINFLTQQGISHIAVACNAASTAISGNKNITGIIEHGINMILKLNPAEICVVGGKRTIESGMYKEAFEKQGIKTRQYVAQQLSIRIEAGDVDSPEMDKDILEIFEPLKASKYILLACTHYPAIADRIRHVAKDAMLIDPADEMKNWIVGNWQPLQGNGSVTWLTTGHAEQMKYAAHRAFDIEINNVKKLVL